MPNSDSYFRDIFSAHQPRIHRYLKRMVGAEEAEDLTQEVFAKVSQALPSFEGKAQLSTWIYRIATNKAIDRLRSASFRKSKESVPADDVVAEFQVALKDEKNPTADKKLIEDEMNQCIRNYIANLPGSYRAVVTLSELEGFKNREIADILEISLDTVKIRLHRARARLKKEFERGCHFFHTEDSDLACAPDQKIPKPE
ncbi:MAG: sigma-70 family RNA polymerase sigma factor [Planctomycetes bacterium]|nr:sigma-70 family RNA polymerase sigma factor [Planctomycetota bacterium]